MDIQYKRNILSIIIQAILRDVSSLRCVYRWHQAVVDYNYVLSRCQFALFCFAAFRQENKVTQKWFESPQTTATESHLKDDTVASGTDGMCKLVFSHQTSFSGSPFPSVQTASTWQNMTVTDWERTKSEKVVTTISSSEYEEGYSEEDKPECWHENLEPKPTLLDIGCSL